tara:strand:+ start:1786 stop:2073 length:288 start_codon:yes stop_codon:yes gene_type:complete
MKKHEKLYGLFNFKTGERIWARTADGKPFVRGSYVVATRIPSAEKKACEAGWVPNGTGYIVEKLITLGQQHSAETRFANRDRRADWEDKCVRVTK